MNKTTSNLSSFMVISMEGGDRLSYTYDEINAETGELISRNNKRNFYAVNPELKEHIEAVRNYIKTNKLQQEQ